MQQCLKRFLRLAAVFIGVLLGCRSPLYAQPALQDSLQQLLRYFQEHAPTEKVKEAAREAGAGFRSGPLDSALSRKLLAADDLLVQQGIKLNRQKVHAYASTLVQALQQLPSENRHPDLAAGFIYLANHYMIWTQYKEALPAYERALALYKSRGDSLPEYAACLYYIAQLYKTTGKLEKALSACLLTVETRKKYLGMAHPDYAKTINFLGSLYHTQGQFRKALELYEQALTIYRNLPGSRNADSAAVFYNMANLYKSTGQYEKALPLYQQALAIRKKEVGEEHTDYAIVLHNLANLYKSTGQFERARTLYLKVLKIRKNNLAPGHPDFATTLNNLGNLYKNDRRFPEALDLYRQAIALRKKALTEDNWDYATTLNNLAFAYAGLEQYDKALPLYLKALDIYKAESGESHRDYASTLNNLGDLYRATRQYQKALPLYQQAVAIRQKALGADHRDYAIGLNDLGLMYATFERDAEAALLLTQASHTMLKHLQQSYTTFSEQEKMAFLKRESRLFSGLPSMLYAHHISRSPAVQQVYENELALKGMVLEDQRQVFQLIRNSGDDSAVKLYEHWRLNKAAIGLQLLWPTDRRQPSLDSLQEATNLLEQQLSRRAAAFRSLQQSRSVTPADISRNLKPGEAAVEFLRFSLYRHQWTDSVVYAALVLRPGDTAACFVPLFEEQQLQRLLKPLMTAKNYFTQYEALARLYSAPGNATRPSLYSLIWKPLEKYLAGAHTVYYAPAGLLHRIAFGALPPDASHALIDRLQLKQVLSTRTAGLPAAPLQKPTSVALWGNIDYKTAGYTPPLARQSFPGTRSAADADPPAAPAHPAGDREGEEGAWDTLPGTKREIDSLENLFRQAGIPVEVDSGALATETAFKGLSGNSPKVVHIATHGFFLPAHPPKDSLAAPEGKNSYTSPADPMLRSGLVLAGGNLTWKRGPAVADQEDGILTAYDITQMDLSHTGLVVLSACETALGEVQGYEGVIGLQRAFKLAGTRQLLMSMWRVPDHQTSELMTLFYRNWIGGQPPRAALRSAQLKLKEKYTFFYWAAFVLVE
ncbi:CHAT domain-containing tetratricopeptide repeat protein [Paraflavisolibacter sp. H34]|uniref:CHAT domain-containing protein n=1 Tax=Huijunlia imazamoxiresistens TaxID=3127457 RepID=UPI00301A3C71